jgi:Kef-type K+ transport system membrane component KefB
MQLMSTSVGFITVCAAAAGDIVAWILVALLVSLINATTPIMPLYVVLMAIGWCIVLAYVVRPLLLSLVRLTHSVIVLCDILVNGLTILISSILDSPCEV